MQTTSQKIKALRSSAGREKGISPGQELITAYDNPGKDEVANLVNRHFKAACSNRRTERAGRFSVEERLNHARYAMDDEYEPCDDELIEESGVDVYLPVISTKVSVVHAFVKSMIQSNPKLISFRPTSLPDLSESDNMEVVRELRALLGGLIDVGSSEIIDQIKSLKTKYLNLSQQQALVDSRTNELTMQDWLEEFKFDDELNKFMQYLIAYPYAVMVCPVETRKVELEWKGDKAQPVENWIDGAKTIDPANYWWASDSTGGGTGAYDIILDTMSRSDLQRIVKSGKGGGWRPDAVSAALSEFSTTSNFKWLSGTTSMKEKAMIPWGDTDSIKVIRYFGRMSKETAETLGDSAGEVVDCEVQTIVCGNHTLFHKISPMTTVIERPIHTASWQNRGDKVCGKGLAWILRDVQRLANMSIRNLVVNAGYASGPVGEYDVSRLKHTDEPEINGQIVVPGRMIPVSPDSMGNNRNVYNFSEIPNHTGQYSNLLTLFLQMADNVSQIPASLSGTPVGTGANRTFRGMMQLQKNSMRVIESAFDNVDTHVLEPIGQYFTHKGLLAGKFRGDSKAKVHGIGGVLRDEIKMQMASENLQLVAQLASVAPDKIPPGTMEYLFNEILSASNIPTGSGGASMPGGSNTGNPPSVDSLT